ncbi:extracellular solute-binding protein [Streptomyces sp. DSM 44915]|uniref:Extracellular solute-binding protein n=1 Tax=Streptomyces chisholmiae TaxID=3075540 RepID=A0ABU2JZ99_9ACTN|nr:extracellular solute-binding protein [Streptomyces sp. DSM 44915]MDT0270326.1 extracellular solute-binding protein [Streptomyces sp. DSM 44915]
MREAALVGAALLALATACTGGPAPAAITPGPAPPDDVPLVVVSAADLTSPDESGVRQSLIDAWNERSPIKARLVELSSTDGDARAEVLAGLQSGAAEYDVLNLDVSWIPEFAAAGLVTELDERLVEPEFVADVARTGWWRDRLYAVPFNTDVGLLYYRRDLLESVDLWGDSLPALYAGRAGGQRTATYVTQLRPYEGLVVNVLEALWTAVPDRALVDADGDYVGTLPQLEAGLGLLRDIADRAHLSTAALDADETGALEEFARLDGGTALMRNWPFALNRVADRLAADRVPFGVTRLPGVAALGGQSLAVAASSPRAAAAEELIRFLTGDPANQARLLDAGFAPALSAAYRLPADFGRADCEPTLRVATPTTDDGSGWAGTSGSGEEARWRPDRRAHAALLWCALQDARSRPATPYYRQFSQVIQEEVGRLLTEDPARGQSVEETAERLHARLPLALQGRLPPPTGPQDHGG